MTTPLWIVMLLVPSLVAAAPSNAEKDMKGPVFIKEPDNRIDFSNSTGSVVECRANASPPPEIIWVRSDGTAVGDVPGLRQVLPNGNLVFPPFRAEDYRQEVHAQVYACLAKNQVGSIISRDVHVRAGKLTFFLHPSRALSSTREKPHELSFLGGTFTNPLTMFCGKKINVSSGGATLRHRHQQGVRYQKQRRDSEMRFAVVSVRLLDRRLVEDRWRRNDVQWSAIR